MRMSTLRSPGAERPVVGELGQALAGEHLARVRGRRSASRSYSIAVSGTSAPVRRPSGAGVEVERAAAEAARLAGRRRGAAGLGLDPAQHAPHPGQQLAQLDRLRQVVVGAAAQAREPARRRRRPRSASGCRPGCPPPRSRRAIAKPSSPGMLTSRTRRSAGASASRRSSSAPSGGLPHREALHARDSPRSMQPEVGLVVDDDDVAPVPVTRPSSHVPQQPADLAPQRGEVERLLEHRQAGRAHHLADLRPRARRR